MTCPNRQLAASLAGLLLGAGAAWAVPQVPVPPTVYEAEPNDFWAESQPVDASSLQSDESGCLFLTGKLQRDYVWDIEPKCALRAYAKPIPARDAEGHVIAGQFCEPVIAAGNDGVILGLAPLEDRTVRLAIAALSDAFDGTVNGLNQNGPHSQLGLVRIEVVFRDAQGQRITQGEPDVAYDYRFASGEDAGRFAFRVPVGVATVDAYCRVDIGEVGVCYDVDYYRLTGLEPGAPYCITVIGGLDEDCLPTDTVLGWFDKQGYLIGGPDGFDDDGAQAPYSQICVFAEVDGSLWFAVSGHGDADFNGLYDQTQSQLESLHHQLLIRNNLSYGFTPGASTRDASVYNVNRYPLSIWNDAYYAAYFAPGAPPESRFGHGVCGGYCIKIAPAEHVPGGAGGGSGGSGGAVLGPARADVNDDGLVNASDLALLLSYWGMHVR